VTGLSGNGFNVSGSGSEIMNCEVDGSEGLMMGFGVNGTDNYIHHNNVHHLGVSTPAARWAPRAAPRPT
jgi:hypothetical protein